MYYGRYFSNQVVVGEKVSHRIQPSRYPTVHQVRALVDRQKRRAA
eukprot:COSAG05_NODE_423_length_9941_cov_241.298821_3_plen_45_part_00